MTQRNNRWTVQHLRDGIWWSVATYKSRDAALSHARMMRDGSSARVTVKAWRAQ